jgi:hypothetical protein
VPQLLEFQLIAKGGCYKNAVGCYKNAVKLLQKCRIAATQMPVNAG